MKNITKRLILLLAILVMLASFCSSSAFAASCLFGHKAVANPNVEATCTENGSYGGSYCSKCGAVIEEATVVPATGHTKNDVPTVNPATVDLDGAYVYSCINCNMAMDSVAIPKIDLVKLSTAKCTYNGKVRKPTVTAKDSAGKTLIAGQDYDVVYPDGMKMPGKHEITVNFKGNYSGEKKIYFTIAPKATTGIKAKTATASSITLVWSKTTGATGYRVYQYSPSKGEYVLKKSLTGTSCKVTGLKGDTTYKFKIRPYTKAEDGTVILGDYSSALSAKTTYGVAFADSSATIYVGATKQLKATTAPANKTLTWKSSNTSIAKVSSSGKVTAVKNGAATITAYFVYNGKTYKATYEVTVKNPSIELSETSATITKGETLKLTATTAPTDVKVAWKSSKTSVATVSSSGEVAAKKTGTVTITASFKYSGKTYKSTCKVTVEDIGVKLNKTSATIHKGDTLNLIATVSPADLAVTWMSSDASVATVSSNGVVTAKETGTATITASVTYKEKTYEMTCEITVDIASSAEYIAKLISYIEKNGELFEKDFKGIKYSEETSSHTNVYGIVYDAANGTIIFGYKIIPNYRGGTEGFFTAELDINTMYVDFKSLLTTYDYYGRIEDEALTEDTIKASNYSDEYCIYDYWKYNTYDDIMLYGLPSLLRSLNKDSMSKLDELLYEVIGVGLKEIGFTNYAG